MSGTNRCWPDASVTNRPFQTLAVLRTSGLPLLQPLLPVWHGCQLWPWVAPVASLETNWTDSPIIPLTPAGGLVMPWAIGVPAIVTVVVVAWPGVVTVAVQVI